MPRSELLATATLIAAAGILAAPVLRADWVDFADETSIRLPVPLSDPALTTQDPEEKDYAWGDLDNDGDIDVVVVRKEPFTSTGRRPNVLLMHEGVDEGHPIDGVFVDRTAEYASASDVDGDEGFLTPTNDRDVAVVDVDNDGWLDVVTAVTLTDGAAKHLSHPRVYMNLGEIDGVWQGLEHQDARIPEMHPTAGPRFCSVAAGDLNGDGFADLYFGDYDSGPSQIFDYNNRLLINDGTGFFADETEDRLTTAMRESAFGAASVIEDMNADGVPDVVKQTSLNAPQHVAVTYNDPDNEGFFDFYDTVYEIAPYFVSVGDLNGDGSLDIVVVDDGLDRYMINQGNDGAGHAEFVNYTFPSGSDNFGGNSWIDDLNNDGLMDVIITDVDVDISGCSRRMHIYRNQGGTGGGIFQEQGEVIPFALSNGTHDVAVFDINGDGWLDMIVGRCTDTRIWINQPPTGIVFNYPDGLPAFVTPDEPFEFTVGIQEIGGGTHDPGSVTLFVSVGDGPFESTALSPVGESVYGATLPAAPCTERIRYYVTADLKGGGSFTDPSTAPATTFAAVSAAGTAVVFRDELEDGAAGWTVESQALSSGAWELADPNGTIFSGNLAAPEDDATAGADAVMAFVTENGAVGGEAGAADLDGGPTTLFTPMFDLDGADATISYARWFFCDDEGTAAGDVLTTEISNDGGASWTSVPGHATTGTGSAWESVFFRVSDVLEPTSAMQVRFVTADQPNDSVTEAGIDNFQIEQIVCGVACPADIDGDGAVAVADLLAVLGSWGDLGGAADVTQDGVVDVADLLAVLAAWGDCG